MADWVGLSRPVRGSTETAIRNVFDLGKALTEAADDGKECFIEVEYDANDARRYGAILIGAQTLREIRSLSRTSTSTTHETFCLVMQRVDLTNVTSNGPLLLHFWTQAV